jgi:hypothetical protein
MRPPLTLKKRVRDKPTNWEHLDHMDWVEDGKRHAREAAGPSPEATKLLAKKPKRLYR